MILKIFSVYDVKARAFMPPFFVPHAEMAMRSFTECANDKAHAFSRSPTDYTLYLLGTFNDDNAIITMEPQPHNLGNAASFKESL